MGGATTAAVAAPPPRSRRRRPATLDNRSWITTAVTATAERGDSDASASTPGSGDSASSAGSGSIGSSWPDHNRQCYDSEKRGAEQPALSPHATPAARRLHHRRKGTPANPRGAHRQAAIHHQ